MYLVIFRACFTTFCFGLPCIKGLAIPEVKLNDVGRKCDVYFGLSFVVYVWTFLWYLNGTNDCHVMIFFTYCSFLFLSVPVSFSALSNKLHRCFPWAEKSIFAGGHAVRSQKRLLVCIRLPFWDTLLKSVVWKCRDLQWCVYIEKFSSFSCSFREILAK